MKNPRRKPGQRKRPAPRRPRGGRWLRAAFLCTLTAAAAASVIALYYMVRASRYDLADVEKIPERTAIYDCRGNLYARLAGENRIVIAFDAIPHNFLNALLAREDTRFYRHFGVDPIGIGRAVLRNLLHRGVREGGSTVTQQLALNTFLGGRHVRTLDRKLLEAFLAFRIEENFTKHQILEHYANRIYFGSGMYGLETACQAYFGKPAKAITLGEAAMLAGMIRSPNRLNPITNPEAAARARNQVLNRMTALEMIRPEDAAKAKAEPVSTAAPRTLPLQENYAMDAVRIALDAVLTDEQIDEGGLRVFTSLDPDLQSAAEAGLEKTLLAIESRPGYPHPTRSAWQPTSNGDPTPYLQGAVLVLDNATGGIRAIVGGRDYRQSRFNRALHSPRQVGSTFKPFVFAAALANGMDIGRKLDDGPIRPGEVKGAPGWSPGNADGTFKGSMSAAEGLIQSRNTIAVRVGEIAGLHEVRRIASQVGLGVIPRQPSICLGSFEATLKDLVSAYTAFPNDGVRRTPYIIERIEDGEGNVLYRAKRQSLPAFPKNVAASINVTLQAALERGTASAASAYGFKRPAAGKTGTTNNYRDAWFCGYSSSLTCGVWVGLDRPQTIIEKGYGATLALPVWCHVMNAADPKRYPFRSFGSAPKSDSPSPGSKPQKENWLQRFFR